MLAIAIYVVTVLAVVAIGLITVGRETFAASQVARPVVFELDEAVEYVSAVLDDRTAGRLTPDDVLWILTIDAGQLVTTVDDRGAAGVEVLDDEDAIAKVLARRDGERKRLIDDRDVTAVIRARTAFLEEIGAIGPRVQDGDAPVPDTAGPSTPVRRNDGTGAD